jgi:hypothetical protein
MLLQLVLGQRSKWYSGLEQTHYKAIDYNQSHRQKTYQLLRLQFHFTMQTSLRYCGVHVLENSGRAQLLSELIFTGSKNLIGSLPSQSLLEKQIAHGNLRNKARTATVVALITELWDWIAEMKRRNQVSGQDPIEEDSQHLGAANVDTNRRSIFARIFGKGLEIVLALHDTKVANTLITDGLKAIGMTLFEPLDTVERQKLVDVALSVACPRKLNMKRSNQFIEFAQCIGSDLEPPPELQALSYLRYASSQRGSFCKSSRCNAPSS